MIQTLESSVIDKIAAGEVLERPAQLAKELIENSLDAGASEVEIDFSEGGRNLIVRDNGSGISPDELEKALQRHATSKIRNVEDLYRLHSFGFRGEALSSVASVSQLVLTSRTREDSIGHRIRSTFGKVEAPLEVSAPIGSEVSVSQLFENVPARLKFLKSDTSEVSQIKTVVKSFGLSRPDVSFKVSKDGELLLYWPIEKDALRRAEEILNVEPLFLAEGEEQGFKIRAFYGAPNVTLRQNRGLWLFVQGRFVQDRAIGAAVMEAYRNLLMHGEYPHCVLFIDLPPDQVDVNVHPTKSQVRFANPSQAFRSVVHVLRDHLHTTPWLKSSSEVGVSRQEAKWLSRGGGDAPSGIEVKDQMTFLERELKKTQFQKKSFALKDSQNLESFPPTLSDLRTASDRSEVFRSESEPSTTARAPDFQWGSLQVLGQMDNTYILAQSDSDFYMVDQHAAHERVVFERLMLNWKEGKVPQQNFLLPLSLDFSEVEVESLLLHKEDLEKMGIGIEQAGPQTLVVNSVPEVIKEAGVAKALQIFADQISSDSGSFAVERAIGDVFASMSCHSVVRAGQALSTIEMKSLLEQMDEFPFSSFCPHGRPVYIKKSFSQIEREFGRIC
ncbi:DNA mismatch repair endonuclease MutL [bacterium]|nr:DNA mismatch repair endonuclease MutL [bacterium]